MSSQTARVQGAVAGEDLVAALQKMIASPGYRAPTLPAVAMEVMQLASRPDVKFHDVVQVLQQDPVMAGRVLSIAQSAAYATRTPTLSLHQAAVRLGLKTLRDLVLEAALHVKVFRVPGYEAVMGGLYLHSTATAHVVRAVCRRTLVNAEYAFLCGLLHDIGFAGALLAAVEKREWRRLPFETLGPVVDQVHVEVSALLCERWKLPEPIRQLVATHHQVVVDGRPQQANAALVIAERLAQEAGAGLVAAEPGKRPVVQDGSDALFEEARRALRMDDAALAAMQAEAAEIVAGLARPAA